MAAVAPGGNGRRGAVATLGAAFLAWPFAAAWGQPRYAPDAPRPPGLGPVQRQERHFLQVAAASLQLQAQASRDVLARSGDAATRELATAVMTRHQDAQPALLRLLHARGMALPMPPNEHRRLAARVARAQGARLDRLYAEDVVWRTCEADLPAYERMAAGAADPALRAWAEGQLPTLRYLVARAKASLPAAPGRAVQRAL